MTLLFLLLSTAMMPKGKYDNKIEPCKNIPTIIYAEDYKDLQDAINDIEKNNNGGTIILTPGEYNPKNPPLKISKSGITIKSDLEASASKIIIKINKDTNGIEIVNCNSIKLQGFTLEGKNNNHYNGIYAPNICDIKAEDITITNFGKNGWYSGLIWGSRFERVIIANIKGNGWDIHSGTSNTWINCYVSGIDFDGFKITSWYSSLINCSADWVKGCAYNLLRRIESGENCGGTTIINCGAERCSGKLINIEGASNGINGFHARLCGDSLKDDALITISNYTSHCYIRDMFIFGPQSAYTFDFPAGSIWLENIHPYCFDIGSAIFKSKNADIIWPYAARDTINWIK